MVEIQQVVAVVFALAVVLVFAVMLHAPAVTRGSKARIPDSANAPTSGSSKIVGGTGPAVRPW
jgi:hypothetical protein